jgi:hypothetical protein
MVGCEICDRTHTYSTSSALVRVRIGSVYRWMAGIGTSMSLMTYFQQLPTRIRKVRLLTGCVNQNRLVVLGDEWMLDSGSSTHSTPIPIDTCPPSHHWKRQSIVALDLRHGVPHSEKKYFACQLLCVLTAILHIRTLGVCWTD